MAGKIDKAKGHAKQALGELTGRKKLAAKGKIDVAAGTAKQTVKTAGRSVKKTTKKIKKLGK